MLKINVRGENIEVTGAIREYVEKRNFPSLKSILRIHLILPLT